MISNQETVVGGQFGVAVLDQPVRRLADAHGSLVSEVQALQAELEACKRARLGRIKVLVARMRERRAEVSEMIGEHPEAFEKPRTVELHGWRLGLRKQRGGLRIGDVERTVELIEKVFGPEEGARLLRIKKSPDKEALDKLTVCELRKVGVEVLADTDKVVVEPTTDDVDRIVDALMKAGEEEGEG